jgi:hypothetical protein
MVKRGPLLLDRQRQVRNDAAPRIIRVHGLARRKVSGVMDVGDAFAGHAGEGPVSLPVSLMPHEIVMLVAGLVLIVLTISVVLSFALRRISRLERRVGALEHHRPPSGGNLPSS